VANLKFRKRDDNGRRFHVAIVAGKGKNQEFGPAVPGTEVQSEDGRWLYVAGSHRDTINVVYRVDLQNMELALVRPRYFTGVILKESEVIVT